MRQRGENVTVRDVAAAAGVSPATISRWFNKSLNLPAATSARIKVAIQKTGYRPNPLARRLSKGVSEVIGLVTPDIANPFFAKLASAVEEASDAEDYRVVLCSSRNIVEREIGYLERLTIHDADGLLFLTNHPDDGTLRDVISKLDSVVILDEDVPGASCTKIFVENEKGGYLATRHLIEMGHQRIAYIGGPESLLSSEERFQGWRRALSEAGVSPDPALCDFGAYDRPHGNAAVKDLLKLHNPPTAIFAGSDYVAIGAIEALRSLGLKVPEDVSIVGFDDMPFSEFLSPPLTTVRQPVDKLGRLGFRLLLESIQSSTRLEPKTCRLKVELARRNSVGPPRKGSRL